MIMPALSVLAVILLLFLGMPVAVALGLVGLLGLFLTIGVDPALSMLALTTTETVLNYNLSVLPLFVLMGALMSRSRLADDLFESAHAFVGHIRGGMSMSTILACASFSAVSGSALACGATMAPIAVPTMRRYGYARGFAGGTVAAGSTLDILIPPSTVMIIYSLFTETSLEKLMIAGLLPGLLTVGLYLLTIYLVTLIKPELGPPGARSDWSTRIRSLRTVWPMATVFSGVIGGIYFGIFTPTEAAGIGAMACLLGTVGSGRLPLRRLFDVLVSAARTTAVLFFVLIGAFVYANYMITSGAASLVETWVIGLELPPISLLLLIIAIYLLIGTMVESTAMLVISIPIFFPIIMQAGIDPIYFGIIVVIMGGIGIITPPVGILLFLVRSLVPGSTVGEIIKGTVPFLVADVVRMALILMFPIIVLLLPHAMS